MSKIIVGMSGGVDSSVVAHLLKQQGHEVIGVFMRNWDSLVNNDILGNPNKDASICPEEQEWIDVQEVAKTIGIKVYKVNFVKEYWDYVFEDMIDKYRQGYTPNPDILCNKYIKFGAFLKWIEKKFPDFDYVATGHYAKIENGILSKPQDDWKDQTYFLAQVNKKVLNKVLFPLSDYTKEEVRNIAKEANLSVHNKKDSTGICFIGERHFIEFLQNYIPAQPGNVVDIKTNKIVGKHNGAMYYTIGQRKGLNLGGLKEPHYVAGHDLSKKIIYVSPQSDNKYLLSDKIIIKDINWFPSLKEDMKNIEVKLRYKSKSISCNIKWSDQELIIDLANEFEAATLGQQAVFYSGEVCLGGGTIDKVFYKGQQKDFL